MDFKCPVCGSLCLPGEKFCQNCGTKLPAIAPAAPAYEPPAQPAAPVYEQPAPAYEPPAQPAAPIYEQPAPAYEPPAQPAEPPAYAQNVNYSYAEPKAPAPAYAAPTPAPAPAPAPAAKPKKKKTGLIVTLCIVGVLIAALVASYFFLFTPNSVALSSEAETLKSHTTLQLTAKINPGIAFLSKGITWTSSDNSIATVDENGKVTAEGNPGTCIITATTGNGKTATCTVTVEVPPTALYLSEKAITVEAGESTILEPEVYPANASGYTITWTSDDPSVATVSDGRVTAVSDGTCTITATISGSIKATCDVTVGVAATGIDVSDYWVDLYVGETQTLEVEVTPENATNYTVTWTSDDPSVATVRDGEITAVGAGSCTIRAAISDDVYAECWVDVSEGIEIADSEYDKYILGEWRMTLVYDWDTDIDTPVEDLGVTGSITFNSDHTARMTFDDESYDVAWVFDSLDYRDGLSRYAFWLYFDDEGEFYYSFEYIVERQEIWLFIDDVDNGYTYTYEK